jgi:hypothetical protein
VLARSRPEQRDHLLECPVGCPSPQHSDIDVRACRRREEERLDLCGSVQLKQPRRWDDWDVLGIRSAAAGQNREQRRQATAPTPHLDLLS